MILEAELSRSVFSLSQATISRLSKCLQSYSLPITINDPRIKAVLSKRPEADLSAENLLDIMRVDKKNEGDKKKVVLLERIGKTWEERASTVADDVIRRVLCDSVKMLPRSSASVKKEEVREVKLAVPGSKSVSNRALVLAALCSGTTRLRGLLHSDDTSVMMSGLSKLGAASFGWEDSGNTIVVKGSGGKLNELESGEEIYLQNAGTAARFMTTVVSLVGKKTTITGNKRMKERPIGDLVDALRSNGIEINYKEGQGCLPLEVTGTSTSSSSNGVLPGLKGGKISLSAKISSQYVSSILLCAPYAQEPVTLELVGGEVISQLYIDMTISMMSDFGVKVQRLQSESGEALNVYQIPMGTYVPPNSSSGSGSGSGSYDVEGDASSATYPLALAALRGTSCTVTNIGSSSLQGDARFANDVLGKMGCVVEQTEKETTVIGPKIGELKQIGLVDMEPMTDAFLTASVVLASAPLKSADGKASTRITGIANQRVKECNRIQAMMDELAKLGIQTSEHEDGLEIFGKDPLELAGKLEDEIVIHCYDDHRVGMSFSCLGAGLSQIKASKDGKGGMVLDEKRCVEKTWPSWWDDLNRQMGINVAGLDMPSSTSNHHANSTLSSASRRYSPNATIFCIGMRASGKTYLGGFGAAALRRPFLDADVVFNERVGLNGFVAKHGWPAFRTKETEILKEFMTNYSEGHLVSLGGGVVETPENRKLLKEYAEKKGPVVYVKRDIDEVVKFLETSDRPSYGEPVRDVFKRREPFFRECSSAELVSYGGGKKEKKAAFDADEAPVEAKILDKVTQTASDSMGASSSRSNLKMEASASIKKTYGLEAEVSRFFRFISGVETNQVTDLYQSSNPSQKGRRTYFLCLTFPDITPALEHLETLSIGVDAIEFRVDLLNPTGEAIKPGQKNLPSAEYVENQLASLRQCTSLPIIFTVRTASQGGAFPDEEEDAYFKLLELGLRHGCEYLDLEIRWSESRLKNVKDFKGHSKILASWHDWTGKLDWESKQTRSIFEEMKLWGDIVKIVGKATSISTNVSLENFRKSVSSDSSNPPFLGINMGGDGQLSRILNPVLSPVSHQNLPSKAAPGQLTMVEMHQAQHLIGLLPKKQFYLFGTPIQHSLSPTLHNEGFKQLGMPHQYDLCEKKEVDEELKRRIRADDFGGASVTIPLSKRIQLFSQDGHEYSSTLKLIS